MPIEVLNSVEELISKAKIKFHQIQDTYCQFNEEHGASLETIRNYVYQIVHHKQRYIMGFAVKGLESIKFYNEIEAIYKQLDYLKAEIKTSSSAKWMDSHIADYNHALDHII